MNILKTEGHKFPDMKDVSDKLFVSDVAPEWAEGDVCHRCRVAFSLVQRKHHCRNCGQVFCGQCSSKNSTLPRFGIEKEVRVCDGCFDQLQKPQPATAAGAVTVKKEEEELPAEYLNSSLAQQSQQPVRKTEEELREEEELQLALALSQSEAESKKQQSFVRTYPKSPSPEIRRSPSPVEPETPSDPELARYLNRGYWENRQISSDAPQQLSPTAPSPMPSSISVNIQKSSSDQDIEIDEFASTMRTQVEIFVNRMKSNSSRGRSIANDTSVQTLFMNITSMHSRLLTYIKEMDDKRLWYEQLQDKLSQVKDSRAALDVLRQEHLEKLRRVAEEQERQRQMQMAYKLEIMRKKKQEYLQYQRQLALQRIQEQEREMQMRQEQQKAQYMMGANNFPQYMSPPSSAGPQGSPMHAQGQFNQYGAYPQGPYGQMPMQGMYANQQQQQQPGVPPNPQSAFMPINPAQNTMQMGQPGIRKLFVSYQFIVSYRLVFFFRKCDAWDESAVWFPTGSTNDDASWFPDSTANANDTTACCHAACSARSTTRCGSTRNVCAAAKSKLSATAHCPGSARSCSTTATTPSTARTHSPATTSCTTATRSRARKTERG